MCESRTTSIDCGVVACSDDGVIASPIDTAISDHRAQRFVLDTGPNVSIAHNMHIGRRTFRTNSIYSFYIDIENYNWNFVFDIKLDINEKFCKLIRILIYYLNVHFPIKHIFLI